ncbi:hypothetical protein [Pseudomonas sp. B22129]|uniref:hypothetical protein n=1 Tax=Pseudomonas sp. B22129 TaxID=3235111 RepID=UPI0037839751
MVTLKHLSLVHDRYQQVVVRHLVSGVLVKTEVLDERPTEFDELELNGITYRVAMIMGVEKGTRSDRGSLIQPQADVHYIPLEAK